MNESEQAEIKRIREALADKSNAHAFDEYSMRAVLSLVDSQAQKIAEQAMQIEKLAGLNHVAEAQIERQAMQIAEIQDRIEAWEAGSKSQSQIMAEQAQEIKRLKAANDAAEKARINSSLNEYYRKSL